MIDPQEMKYKFWPANTTDKMKRPPGTPTPCFACVKCEGLTERTPAKGREVELSNKNWRTLELYYRAQAMGGRLEGIDAIARKNFGTIHRVLTGYSRTQMAGLLKMLPALRGL